MKIMTKHASTSPVNTSVLLSSSFCRPVAWTHLWWHFSTQIWVMLLIGWKFPSSKIIRSTSQIWVVAHHQYEIYLLVTQMLFCGETSGAVMKCQLFSQVTWIAAHCQCENRTVLLLPIVRCLLMLHGRQIVLMDGVMMLRLFQKLWTFWS